VDVYDVFFRHPGVGSRVNVMPHAVRELEEIDLLDELSNVGVAAAVVKSNRRAGPHRCQDLVEERAPDGFKELADVITRQQLEDIAADYKRIGGFDIERVNNRASLSASPPAHARRHLQHARTPERMHR
jgi:hypothetical protein